MSDRLSFCRSICLSVCPSVFVLVCLSLRPCVCLSVCLCVNDAAALHTPLSASACEYMGLGVWFQGLGTACDSQVLTLRCASLMQMYGFVTACLITCKCCGRSDFWPHQLNHNFIIYVYTFIVAVLFLGPQDRPHNFALTAFWGYWWPGIFLVYPFLGRIWCSSVFSALPCHHLPHPGLPCLVVPCPAASCCA